ncbi:MAG: diguanylate cyclase [Nitrospirae bacterium]|nr:diguanylate cyclase [Nitrospirota bacterium]
MAENHDVHVIVTDDSLTVRMMLKQHLETAGYQVSAFSDGEACMAFLESAPKWPDLVVLDLIMPGVDGITVLGWIKARQEHGFTPVILLTALDDVNDRVRGLDQGADDYISKPFEANELLARVRVQLRIKRLQDQLTAHNAALTRANEEKAQLLGALEAKNEQLAVMATTDPLTGIANRGHIEAFIGDSAARAARFGERLTVAMVDIDHFKRLNDTHGHPFGDRVIREVSRVLAESVRRIDKVGRYGGEEFLLVLPETDAAGAMVLGERIRQRVAALDFAPHHDVHVTLSGGVASWTPQMASWEELVAVADQALYRAKEGGRNRICGSPPDRDGIPA